MGSPHPGTPTYMAPEQISSTAPLTPAADIYALGCVLFEMLTGTRYKRKKPGTRVAELRGDIPAWLDALVARAVAEEPWERFEDATAMLTALETRHVDKVTGARPAPSPLRWLAALGAVLAIAVVGWFAFQAVTNRAGGNRATPTAVSVAGGNPAVLSTPNSNATIAAAMAATQAPVVRTAEALGIDASDLKLDPETGMLIGVNPIDGAEYVRVSEGAFMMGSNINSQEQPIHEVTLDAFWIMRTEVTNEQYGKCVVAGVCSPPNLRLNDNRYAQHPVTDVDWNQASTYARWAGGRLPTEAEWEKACRSTDERAYPWGNQAPTVSLLNFDDNVKNTTAVGSYAAGASPYGAFDMAGNVWEWTADWYDSNYYNTSPNQNPTGPTSGDGRALRGGSFNANESNVRCAVRDGVNEDFRYQFLGFRVVIPDF